MKPLLSAPPTEEDSDIWLSIVVGYGLDWATVGVIFRDADRRDADLMHALMHGDVSCDVCWRGMPETWRPDGLGPVPGRGPSRRWWLNATWY